MRAAVASKTEKAREELAGVRRQVAQRAEEWDAISVQIDQCRAEQEDERGKLAALQGEVATKQALAGDLADEIEIKAAKRDEIQAQISDFSAKRDAAAERLECVQGELAEVEGIAGAGILELGKLAQGNGAGERESAAQEENRALRARLAALEEEGGELEGRVQMLEQENRGLRARFDRLRGRLDDAWAELVAAAERVRDFVFEQVGGLKWVFEELGLEAYEGMRPLADRGYDLASECRDMQAASVELGREWEPPEPSHGHAR